MSIAGLKPDDIIKVDKKGRRFFAQVRDIEGRVVNFMPTDRSISYRSCTSHEVVGIWRATKATRDRGEQVLANA